MNLYDQKIGGFLILAITGNIVLEDTTKLKEHVEQYIEDSSLEGIIINCENVKFIDSSGLGLIVSIYKTLKKMDKKFALTALSGRTLEIFTLTKLDNILTITKDNDTALEIFKT
ncbi:STAS domain-containing protein [bacterium]|nr:STAS domain-containing protein [bacterium]